MDTLTGSMAPELFYGNLRREIAASNRDHRALSIISIVLNRREHAGVQETDSVFSERIVKVSSVISHGTRADEFFSRISEDGFWVFIRGNTENARIAIARANLDSDIQVDVIEREESENFHTWLRRVDGVHFGS